MYMMMVLHDRTGWWCKVNLFLGGLILLGVILERLLAFGGDTLLTALTGLLNLVSAGLGLVAKHFNTGLSRLLLVNVLHQYTLVLKHVSFTLHVQGVVQVAVDFLGLSVFFKETTEHPHTSHPDDLLRHTGVGGTLPLSGSCVTSLPASELVFADASTRVDSHRLPDDQTILNQFPDVLP